MSIVGWEVDMISIVCINKLQIADNDGNAGWMYDNIRQDILSKLKQMANDSGGPAPGLARFEAATGIKRHEWQGKIWRKWSDVVADAGLVPNELQGALDDDTILSIILDISKSLGRFPTSTDLKFEFHQRPGSPDAKTVLRRWSMVKLADALASYADRVEVADVAAYARSYVPPREKSPKDETLGVFAAGYVYMQRHGSDFKIGYTTSLNKRGRQIQLELPQEVQLVHSILTDDPVGIESYWHKRFASKRTRGEWFKLTKADVAAFKRWSKIW